MRYSYISYILEVGNISKHFQTTMVWNHLVSHLQYVCNVCIVVVVCNVCISKKPSPDLYTCVLCGQRFTLATFEHKQSIHLRARRIWKPQREITVIGKEERIRRNHKPPALLA